MALEHFIALNIDAISHRDILTLPDAFVSRTRRVFTSGGGEVILGFKGAGFSPAFEVMVGLAAIGGRGIGAGGGDNGGMKSVGEITAVALATRLRAEADFFAQSSSVLEVNVSFE